MGRFQEVYGQVSIVRELTFPLTYFSSDSISSTVSHLGNENHNRQSMRADRPSQRWRMIASKEIHNFRQRGKRTLWL